MFATLILAAVMPGQACQVQGTYRQNAVVRSYTAPIYQQTYAAQTYAAPAYAPQYETAYVAVQYYPDYTSIVGEATRARDRRQEALLGQANLAARVDKLSASIDGLTALLAKEGPVEPVGPVVPTPPVAPGKPTPDVPAKPAPPPDVPSTPPLPNTNPAVPDNGNVPPPPSPAFLFPEASATVLKKRCLSCHGAKTAATLGGGHVYFAPDENVRSDLTGGQLLKIVQQVESGRMPKKAIALDPDERGLIRGPIMASPAVEAFLEAAMAKVAE